MQSTTTYVFIQQNVHNDRYHCKTPLEVKNDPLQTGQAKAYPIAQNKRIKKYKGKWCA